MTAGAPLNHDTSFNNALAKVSLQMSSPFNSLIIICLQKHNKKEKKIRKMHNHNDSQPLTKVDNQVTVLGFDRYGQSTLRG